MSVWMDAVIDWSSFTSYLGIGFMEVGREVKKLIRSLQHEEISNKRTAYNILDTNC